jgi:hypothetical protein
MGRKRNIGLLMASIAITIILVAISYYSNLNSVLQKPDIFLILLLLFISIIADIFDIIEFLKNSMSQEKTHEESDD